jgi:hypothetical protein
MRCAYGTNNPSPYGGITRIKSSVEVLRLPLSLSAPVRLCSHLRASVRQTVLWPSARSSNCVVFFDLLQPKACHPTCLRSFGYARFLPLSPYVCKRSGLRRFGNTSDCPLYPYARDPAFCGVLGIPESGRYSHTSASGLVCGGMGIPEPRQCPRAYAIMCVCVGMGILAGRWYSRTAAKSQAGRLM